MFEGAAAVLDAGGFADGFNGHEHGDLLVFGHFMEIHMDDLAGERMMLDFLQQREALGAGVVLHREVYEQVFRGGMIQQVANFLANHFDVLRLGLATINGGGHATGGAQFFDFGALHLSTRIGFQRD